MLPMLPVSVRSVPEPLLRGLWPGGPGAGGAGAMPWPGPGGIGVWRPIPGGGFALEYPPGYVGIPYAWHPQYGLVL